MAMDLETVPRDGKTRFDRRLAALVGIAAITAALLATLEMASGKQEEGAFTSASRLAVRISTRVAVNGLRTSLEGSALTQAASLGLEATQRQLAALRSGDEEAAAVALADERASQRLLGLAARLSEEPSAESGVDRAAREALAATNPDLRRLVAEQNRQVDLAERYGGRENAAIFGLSLLAVAAVLLGLAGLIGEGRQGMRILAVAAVTLAVSIGWGAAALFR
jgi:hypothetical protein